MDRLNNHILELENKSPWEGRELLTIGGVGHTAIHVYLQDKYTCTCRTVLLEDVVVFSVQYKL